MKRLLPPLLLLLLASAALASTPEGTLIEAQASATYIDSANQPRTTTSNLVVTVVQQVYGVAVTPDGGWDGTTFTPGQRRSGIAGSTVDFAYTVRNTGNGRDTIHVDAVPDGADAFSALSIYRDANCNGRRDSGEASITSVVLDMNASACVVLAATLPQDAVDGAEAYATLSATAQDDAGDTDADNWAEATSSDAAVLSAFVLASPTGTVHQGDTIEFTMSGTNIGGSAAWAATDPLGSGAPGILVEATIPAGLEFDSGSASFAAGAGSASLYYHDGTSWSTSEGSTVTRVGLLLAGTDGFFVQGADYELAYTATVPGDAATATEAGDPAAGDTYTSGARVHYRDSAAGTALVAEGNSVVHEVGASHHVLAGPYGLVTGDYAFDGRTVGRTADEQTLALAYAGNAVAFRNTVRNEGNGSDSFALTLDGAPAGWSCGTYGADGSTPATTVGPIASLAAADVVVRCTLPRDATSAAPSGVTLTATSTSDADAADATTDTVTEILSGYGVSFGPGGTVVATDAGATASFDLVLTNDGRNPDSFDLGVTGNDFGSGSAVTFYLGCGAERSAAPVSSTGLVEAGETVCVTAVVGVPAEATSADEHGGNRSVAFTATSTGDAAATATVTHGVDVNHRGGVSFGPNRAGTVTSPGVIDFTHVLRNTGNTTADVTIPAPSGACTGCSVQLSLDGSSFSTSVSGVELAPAASRTVTVRLTVPSGEPIGRRLTIAPVAALDYDGAGGSVSAGPTDTVDVIGGELRLTLDARTCVDAGCTDVASADGATAEPGQHVVYDLRAENLGTAPLKQVVITDPLPAFTDFVSVSAEASFAGTPLYSTDGSVWSATLTGGVAAGDSVYVAIDRDGDGAIDASDTVPVAGVITVEIVTRVQ